IRLLRDALHSGGCERSHIDRRMRLLDRFQLDERFWDTIVFALKLHRIGCPDCLQRSYYFIGVLASFLAPSACGLIFIHPASHPRTNHPSPNPRRGRPPDRTSSVFSRRASNTGGYQGRFKTLVPSAMRRVWAATNVSVSSGSSTRLYKSGKTPSRAAG